MKIRFSLLSGAVLIIGMTSIPSSAQDTIKAFVDSSGRMVFTNLMENAPQTQRVPETDNSSKMPASLDALVTSISTTHGVDPALVRAVIKTESNFNRWAVSRKGALGLMQLIPSTGRQYGVRDFFDPQQNIDGGVRYLKFLLQKFNGDLDLSLAAYNAGENAVERLGRIPPIPETTNYVRKIRSIYKGKSAPLVATADASATTPASTPEPPKIYKVIDERGVLHFSNIEPPN
jgi:soluble lytic murein transglycosylase